MDVWFSEFRCPLISIAQLEISYWHSIWMGSKIHELGSSFRIESMSFAKRITKIPTKIEIVMSNAGETAGE